MAEIKTLFLNNPDLIAYLIIVIFLLGVAVWLWMTMGESGTP